MTRLVWTIFLRVSLVGAIAACTSPPVQLQAQRAVTAFVDVAVVPMDVEQVLRQQTVLVQGDRIIALGPVDRIRVPTGAFQIDGRGKYLIPGLADMHTHLTMGDSADAERALLLFVANGVTTIRNMDYGESESRLPGAFVLRLRALAAAGALVSPRIYTSGQWAPKQYIRDHQDGDPMRNMDSVASYVAAYKAKGYDFVKIHDEDSLMSEAVLVAAHRVGIPAVGHVNALTLEEALAKGYVSIEHLTGWLPDEYPPPWGNPSDTFDTSNMAARVAATRRAGVWNCPTLELYELGAPDIRTDTLARWPELRYASSDLLTQWGRDRTFSRSGLHRGRLTVSHQIIVALQAAGAGLLSGTDASSNLSESYLVPGFSLHRELAALVGAGLTPYQALVTSTRNVAAYFGTRSESGTVAVGKRADLVLLAGNPLVDIHQTTQIEGVMHGGRWFSKTVLAPRLTEDLKALFARN